MFARLRSLWALSDVRGRVLTTFGLLLAARALAHIPAPGVPKAELGQLLSGNQFLGLLELFSGGSISRLSLAMLGVGPYITASIVFQLLAYVVPSLEALQKEGQYGQQKIQQYTRYLAVPLAYLQGYGTVALLKSQGLLQTLSAPSLFLMLTATAAGTVLLMWLGEVISERGIGNGISLIIILGILSGLPSLIGRSLALAGISVSLSGLDLSQMDTAMLIQYGIVAIVAVVILALVVAVTQAIRNIPVVYARGVRQGVQSQVPSNLPLRVNSAGVIPIIFAISLLITPSFMAQFFLHARSAWLRDGAQAVINFTRPTATYYPLLYFILVVVFTFFYTFVIFQPKNIAENLQKQSGYIPGVRPGGETERYISLVLMRLTLFGAVFLGIVAILPTVVQRLLGNNTFSLGGTGLLIVVSVVIETMLAVRAQIVTSTYELD